MKKTLSLTILILFIGTILYLGKTKLENSQTRTNSINIDGVVKDSTGVTIDPRVEKNIRETIILIGKGRVSGDGFSFYPPGDGSIIVELNSPYVENKMKAIEWLKNNGYPNINPDSLVYKEL